VSASAFPLNGADSFIQLHGVQASSPRAARAPRWRRSYRGRGPRARRPPIFTLFALQFSNLPPVGLALIIALLVISLGIHEAAHGWVALQCGDPTARDLGRITLNPIPHIDPFMTILLPAIGALTGGFIFGGAKPVPVSYHNLRSPLRDMALVALAGPASNFLLATFFFLCWKILVQKTGVWDEQALGSMVLLQTVQLNILLSAFNLLPIPPLDGSRVMTWLLPSGIRASYVALERFGLLLVVALVFFFPPVQHLVYSTEAAMGRAIENLVSFGGAW